MTRSEWYSHVEEFGVYRWWAAFEIGPRGFTPNLCYGCVCDASPRNFGLYFDELVWSAYGPWIADVVRSCKHLIPGWIR